MPVSRRVAHCSDSCRQCALPSFCAGAVSWRFRDDGTVDPRLRGTVRAAVVGIDDDDGAPVCTATFISPTRALTVYHDAKPAVGTVLSGQRSLETVRGIQFEKLTFVVSASSRRLDLVVLDLVDGREAVAHLPLVPESSISDAVPSQAWVVTFGISASQRARDTAGAVSLGLSLASTDVTGHGKRHLVYAAQTGKGDSGGGLIDLCGRLRGLHQGGWNHGTSPPASPPSDILDPATAAHPAAAHPAAAVRRSRASSASAAAGRAIAAADDARSSPAQVAHHRQRERLAAMGLEGADKSVIESVTNMARTITTGGWALFLGTRDILSFCAVAPHNGARLAVATVGGSSADAVARGVGGGRADGSGREGEGGWGRGGGVAARSGAGESGDQGAAAAGGAGSQVGGGGVAPRVGAAVGGGYYVGRGSASGGGASAAVCSGAAVAPGGGGRKRARGPPGPREEE